ncbi:DNA-directed RNA polymerase sigma-70 factor [Agaricicola taiwanensis]|uniref:DNA-directed RNA polymerase sigma-70 factor n=2 Tax=Agaricicola taiwanensis TaxID=591372 RepID=A0A8J2YKU4_9RHOB|nr:DNA-directed RNA polymerase sigma-70 factor [Agaricicola taiwanensis]
MAEFSQIYATEHGRLRRLVRRITGSAETAEDIVHDAFLKLSDRTIGAEDRGLLVRTAQNLARDQLRAERVRTAYAGNTMAEQLTPGFALPDEEVAARQELNDLLTAIKNLPPRTRKILLMSRRDGLSYPQIARELDVSVSTVEKDMISALEFCRTWKRRRDLF